MTPARYAEYATPADLLRAIHALRGRGYRRIEAYTPYPLHDLDRALGRGPSRLPFAVLAGAVAGGAGAYALQWLLNAYLDPLDAGGRPPHMPLAFVPITFEMGVLLAALTGLAALIAAGRLLRLWHPAFDVPGFESATGDRWWLAIDLEGAPFDAETVDAHLRATAPTHVEAGQVTP